MCCRVPDRLPDCGIVPSRLPRPPIALRSHPRVDRVADGFLRRVAKDSFCRRIPILNDPLGIDHHHAVQGGFRDGTKFLLAGPQQSQIAVANDARPQEIRQHFEHVDFDQSPIPQLPAGVHSRECPTFPLQSRWEQSGRTAIQSGSASPLPRRSLSFAASSRAGPQPRGRATATAPPRSTDIRRKGRVLPEAPPRVARRNTD